MDLERMRTWWWSSSPQVTFGDVNSARWPRNVTFCLILVLSITLVTSAIDVAGNSRVDSLSKLRQRYFEVGQQLSTFQSTNSNGDDDQSEVVSSSTFSGPHFITEPSSLVEFSNSTGTVVYCSASGNPSPSITWLSSSDGSRLTNISHLRTVYPNGTLVFYPFRADDYSPDVHSLIYRCQISNLVGSIISRPVHIRAVVLQVYEAQVYDDFVMRGNTAILRCQIPSFVSEYVKVTSWIKDPGGSVLHVNMNDSKYTVLPHGDLYIDDVETNDGLMGFRCRIQHRLTGELRLSSTSGKVVVTETTGSVSPRITDSKSNVQGRRGELMIVPCSAAALPPPTYTWYRKSSGNQMIPVFDGEISSSGRYQQKHGVLLIRQVESSDAGSYVCIVRNSLGDEKVETNVVVTEPPMAVIEPQLRTVKRGSSTSFHCITSGFPSGTNSWLHNGKELTGDDGNAVRESKLVVPIVGREQAGMYQCFLHTGHDTVQATAELRLGDSPPEVLWGFTDELRYPGSSVTLKCVTAGNPFPAVSWTLDGLPLPTSSSTDRYRVREHVDTKDNSIVSHITINKIQVEDGGLYRCTASNTAGSASHSARLNVHGLPFIRALPKMTSVEGSNMTLFCPTSGYPIDSIVWMKGDSKVPLDHRQKVFPNGTLLVSNVQRSLDAGKYTCEASNSQGQSSRRDFEVAVLVPPKMIPFSFQDDQIYEGMRVSVFCAISQGDFPMDIQWYKDDKLIPPHLQVNTRTVERYGNTLSIEQVTSAHGGSYTCSATNAAATVNYTAHLTVNVPPKWVSEPKDTNVLAGKEVNLNCSADGFPKPTIIWMKAIDEASGEFAEVLKESDHGRYMCKASNGIGAGLGKVVTLNVQGDLPIEIIWRINGKAISSAPQARFILREYKFDKGMTSQLTISRADRLDAVRYSCLSKNPFGHDETNIYLFILERPEPPSDIWVSEQGSRSAHIGWSNGFTGHSPVDSYLLQYKTASGNWSAGGYWNKSVGASAGGTILLDLRPSNTYHVKVLALNEMGASESSKVISFTTSEEAPSGPPRDIKVEAVDSQTLKVMWKAPRRDQWNGHLLQLLKERDEGEASIQLTSLHKFTRYGVVVRAYNDHGNGPDSDEIVAMTAEDAPNEPPNGLQCSAINSQSLHVRWDPPAPHSLHGVLQGYKIFYRRAEERYEDETEELKMTSALKTILHGLHKYSNYSIRILAFTRVGDGVKSEPVFCKTLEDVPSAPTAIKAVLSSVDGILVTWKPPATPNVKNELLLEVKGLKRHVQYDFWVTASTSIGEGQSTKVISQNTSMGSFVPTKISSIGDKLLAAWQSDVSMECNTIGTHKAEIRWLFNGEPLMTKRDSLMVTSRGSLLIKSAQGSDAGNYTCLVFPTSSSSDSPYAEGLGVGPADSINYQLVVEVPPEAPSVTVFPDVTSLKVQWSRGADGGRAIRGYILSYKSEFGHWSEVHIEKHMESYTLTRLQCGIRYQLYLSALNKIGVGPPSQNITTRTKGSAPKAPPKEKLLVENSTFIVLYLESWIDGGCPILYFVVEYKVKNRQQSSNNDNEYTLVSNNVKPEIGKFVVADLEPSTWYNLRMTAHNSAGSETAVYDFVTLNFMGDSPPSMNMHGSKETVNNMEFDIRIIVLIVVALVVLLAVMVVVCFWFQRKKFLNSENDKKLATNRSNSNARYTLAVCEPMKNCSIRHIGNHVDMVCNAEMMDSNQEIDHRNRGENMNVNPYATSQLLQLSRGGSGIGVGRSVEHNNVNVRRGENRQLVEQSTEEINHFSPNNKDDSFPPRYPAINDLYSKVEKPSMLQLCPKHHLSLPDTEVPDLLDHSLESSSSNDASPQLTYRKSYRALEMIGRTDEWTRLSRDDRYIHQTAETTFIYETGKHDGEDYNCQQELSDVECDRENSRRYRQPNPYLSDYQRKIAATDNPAIISRRPHWKPCNSYSVSSNRRSDDDFSLPI
ncbi:Down syndrome cell adhesion molecule-like protein 1 [Chamberlinius hualienensis]